MDINTLVLDIMETSPSEYLVSMHPNGNCSRKLKSGKSYNKGMRCELTLGCTLLKRKTPGIIYKQEKGFCFMCSLLINCPRLSGDIKCQNTNCPLHKKYHLPLILLVLTHIKSYLAPSYAGAMLCTIGLIMPSLPPGRKEQSI